MKVYNDKNNSRIETRIEKIKNQLWNNFSRVKPNYYWA